MDSLANAPQPPRRDWGAKGGAEAGRLDDQIPNISVEVMKLDSSGAGEPDAVVINPGDFGHRSSGRSSVESASSFAAPSLGFTGWVPLPPRRGAPPGRTSWTVAPLVHFWGRHEAPLLVVLSQLFGVTMNLCVRVLEHSEDAVMHPFQLLLVRQVVTLIVTNVYMWWQQTPQFPFGAPAVRKLLTVRGVSGFFGIYGMWQSLTYLPLAEATVITFLVPSAAAYMCHLAMKDPFTRKEQVACFVALVGVVLLARPKSLMFWAEPLAQSSPVAGVGNATSVAGAAAVTATAAPAMAANGEVEPTPAQRLGSLAAGLVGVLGTAVSIMVIRWIGPRAPTLISINYFSGYCALISAAALVLAPLLDIGQPLLRFSLPRGLWQWFLLSMICLCGFGTQFCITAGLRAERSNRATMMIYTGAIIAAVFDKLVWDLELGLWSVMGGALIIGSAVWAALSKVETPRRTREDVGAGSAPRRRQRENDGGEEGIPMLDAVEETGDE